CGPVRDQPVHAGGMEVARLVVHREERAGVVGVPGQDPDRLVGRQYGSHRTAAGWGAGWGAGLTGSGSSSLGRTSQAGRRFLSMRWSAGRIFGSNGTENGLSWLPKIARSMNRWVGTASSAHSGFTSHAHSAHTRPAERKVWNVLYSR